MSLKTTITAAAFAVALPFAASAATVTSVGVTGDPLNFLGDMDGSVGEIDVVAGGSYGIRFDNDDTEGSLNFVLANNSDSEVRVEIVTTVLQGQTYGFMDGVSSWLNGNPVNTFVPDVPGVKVDYIMIGMGDEVNYDINFGDPSTNGGASPFIDVSVVTAVPIPAAGFLLLGGLGGLALVRRKKSA